MKKKSFIKKIDHLFLFSILFLISLVVMRYFFRSNIACFLASFALSYLEYILLTSLISKKSNTILIKKQDQNNIQSLRDYLITCGTKNALIYLKTAFNGEIKGENIETDTKSICVFLASSEVTLYDFSDIYTSFCDGKEKVIFAEKVSDELANFLTTLEEKITVINISNLYFDYIKDNIAMPKSIYKQKNPTKNTLKSLAKVAFTKKTSKGYFVNGIVIFLFSFLYPFRGYYLVYSLVLFVLSLISYFEPFAVKN